MLPVPLLSCFSCKPIGTQVAKAWNSSNDRFHQIGRNQARALELARRVLVARTPKEILVIEPDVRFVPAAVAGMIIDDPVGSCELVDRVGEAGDHHHRSARGPSDPREPA